MRTFFVRMASRFGRLSTQDWTARHQCLCRFDTSFTGFAIVLVNGPVLLGCCSFSQSQANFAYSEVIGLIEKTALLALRWQAMSA